jgi:uncharacterized protein YjbI with pentapeptide repeats
MKANGYWIESGADLNGADLEGENVAHTNLTVTNLTEMFQFEAQGKEVSN